MKSFITATTTRRGVLAALIIFAAVAFDGTAQGQITIATVPIGNPGNGNDPNTGNVYGGVANNYSIGKYDVTVGQYTAFLNAVAATDTYSLYNPSMATDLNSAGIQQNGSSPPFSYSVIGSANHPVTYVSFFDAARFANWLNNGQPAGPEGPGTTETGAYTLTGTNSPTNVARNAGAQWFIPSESEWYKAAYYDPRTTAQGGPPADSHYWNYATGTNTTPTSAPPGSTPNTANFKGGTTGYAVTGSTSYSSSQNYLTDVGAYMASASPYGTFDQNGDVFQWNETIIDIQSRRGFRGGSWNLNSSFLSASLQDGDDPSVESSVFGIRVANVPEPSTGVLAVVASGLIWALRKRVK